MHFYLPLQKSEQETALALCENCCCRSQSFCFTPGTLRCEELCDVKGKRFRCVCKANFGGDSCNLEIVRKQICFLCVPIVNRGKCI